MGGVVGVEGGRRVVPCGPAVSQGLGKEGGFSNWTVVGWRDSWGGGSLGGAVEVAEADVACWLAILLRSKICAGPPAYPWVSSGGEAPKTFPAGVAGADAACWLISSVKVGVAEVNAACWLAGVAEADAAVGVAEADAACWLISSVKAEARPGWEARSMDRMEAWSMVEVPAGV